MPVGFIAGRVMGHLVYGGVLGQIYGQPIRGTVGAVQPAAVR